MLAAQKVAFEGESVREFLKGFRSEATKDSYTRKLKYFLEFAGVGPNEFLEKTKQDSRWAEHMIIDYVEARRNQERLVEMEGTIKELTELVVNKKTELSRIPTP